MVYAKIFWRCKGSGNVYLLLNYIFLVPPPPPSPEKPQTPPPPPPKEPGE